MSIDAYKGSSKGSSKGTTKVSDTEKAYSGPQFSKAPLRRSSLDADPIEQFSLWYKDAESNCSGYANPVSLGTVNAEGQPVVRTVLLKGFDQVGFRFYTNYQSRKASHMDNNPRVSMCFYWEELERQVIILGSVEKLSPKASDEYFSTRPKGSQIGAHVSSQSDVVASREQLESDMRRLEEKFADGPVPRPEHWGGYLLIPNSIEFWQGQPDRLHDRFIYELDAGCWQISRLAP